MLFRSVKEEKAKFTIAGESEYYLHLQIYDNAGNVSEENVFGPYRVDKTSPKVEVTPAFSDWTNQPVTVDMIWSDEGGSNLQKYKYAVTGSGMMPDQWQEEIVGEPKPIIVNTEGENYLHIVGCDNAGNESSDYIFGAYKLDFTLPELMSNYETTTEEKRYSVTFTAKDKLSGVSKFVVNGTEVNGTQYVATKNGDYQFEILDYAGNQLIKTVKIDDLYTKCDKNLEHPDYSSTYEKCPICDLIQGIKVTNHEKIYEGAPVGISYDNTKNAQIVEYYDNRPEKPAQIGNYLYELKIVYEGNEYKTGITGTFILKEKPKVEEPVEDKNEEEKEDEETQEPEKEVETFYIKSNVYQVEENGSIYNVPQNTIVSEFLQNIETNATTAEVFSPEDIKLENEKVIENGSALVIQKSAEQKEYKIYVKEEKAIEDNFTTAKKILKNKVSGILPYTGGKDKTSALIVSSVIFILGLVSRKLFAKKGKH